MHEDGLGADASLTRQRDGLWVRQRLMVLMRERAHDFGKRPSRAGAQALTGGCQACLRGWFEQLWPCSLLESDGDGRYRRFDGLVVGSRSLVSI